jgi:predicted lipid-binding transport protein (Tim44 family)
LKTSSSHIRLPAGNPIANLLVIVVGILAIAASLVLGFFAFVIVGSIVLIMASIIGIRVWWFKRKMKGQYRENQPSGSPPPGGVIEGEYRVVADSDKDE